MGDGRANTVSGHYPAATTNANRQSLINNKFANGNNFNGHHEVQPPFGHTGRGGNMGNFNVQIRTPMNAVGGPYGPRNNFNNNMPPVFNPAQAPGAPLIPQNQNQNQRNMNQRATIGNGNTRSGVQGLGINNGANITITGPPAHASNDMVAAPAYNSNKPTGAPSTVGSNMAAPPAHASNKPGGPPSTAGTVTSQAQTVELYIAPTAEMVKIDEPGAVRDLQSAVRQMLQHIETFIRKCVTGSCNVEFVVANYPEAWQAVCDIMYPGRERESNSHAVTLCRNQHSHAFVIIRVVVEFVVRRVWDFSQLKGFDDDKDKAIDNYLELVHATECEFSLPSLFPPFPPAVPFTSHFSCLVALSKRYKLASAIC